MKNRDRKFWINKGQESADNYISEEYKEFRNLMESGFYLSAYENFQLHPRIVERMTLQELKYYTSLISIEFSEEAREIINCFKQRLDNIIDVLELFGVKISREKNDR